MLYAKYYKKQTTLDWYCINFQFICNNFFS